VHLSELSWGQVAHPSHLVKVGDKVKVHVLSVDRDGKKIALSMKRLQPEPWALLAENYEVGQEIRVKITKLAPFGAFAEVEPGIEGLIHISELSEERIAHPKQVVREGETVPVRIIRIDAARHRLGLSLRQSSGDFDFEDEPEPAPAATAIATEPTEVNAEAPAEADVPAQVEAAAESTESIAQPTSTSGAADSEGDAAPMPDSADEPLASGGSEPVADSEAEPAVKNESAQQATAAVADA
jgi:small subunit ribosomal protein S1